MPRLVQRVPGYNLHKQNGRARVCLDGRSILLPGPFGSETSKAAYDRIVGEWVAGGRRLPRADAINDLSIAELVNQYRHHCDDYCRFRSGRGPPFQPRVGHFGGCDVN